MKPSGAMQSEVEQSTASLNSFLECLSKRVFDRFLEHTAAPKWGANSHLVPPSVCGAAISDPSGSEMAVERPFQAPSGSEVAAGRPFRAPCGSEVATEWPFRAPSGSEVAAEWAFRAPSGSEGAPKAPSGSEVAAVR